MGKGRTGAAVWAAVLLAGFAAEGAAQEGGSEGGPARATGGRAAPPALRLGRAATEVRIDGVADDAAWESASVASGFIQMTPDEGRPVSEPTEVKVLHDGEALYVVARLGDGTPERIEARLGRRDDVVHADWFYVMVDGYRDRRTAFGFGVSAAGVQRDWRILGDGQEDDPSWDAVWESAVGRGAEGWIVEMRIPLSQLRFVAGADAWGLNFARRIARRNEWAHWAPIPQGSQYFVSLFGELNGVSDLSPARCAEVVPYTVARLTREPGAAADPFHDANRVAGSVGADVRVGLGSSLTLSATLNPDFGQVEADPATVNLTAFEVFQEERRPFFVEGADVFRPSFGGWVPFFYSRRIGRAPQVDVPGEAAWADAPDATTILGAVKLTGRTESGWSLGVLDAVTSPEKATYVTSAGVEGSAPVEPLTNYTAARVARELNQGRTGIGLLATGTRRRLDDDRLFLLHSGAYAASLDGWHRFGGASGSAYELSFAFQGSRVSGDSLAIARTQRAPGHYYQRPDAEHVELDPLRTSLAGWTAGAQIWKRQGRVRGGVYLDAVSPGFEVSDLGFNPPQDQALANAWLNWWDFTPGRVLRQWNLGTSAALGSTTGGERRFLEHNVSFNATFLNFWRVGFWAGRSWGGLDPVALRGGAALRQPAGWRGNASVVSDERKPVSGMAGLMWSAEDGADGGGFESHANISVRASGRLNLSVGPGFGAWRRSWQWAGRASGPQGDVPLVGALEQRTASLSLRADYTFSPELTFQLFTRPFLATGRYVALREVTDAHARAFDQRFRTFDAARVTRADGRVAIDGDANGDAELTLRDPDFNARSLQLNAVLRWEYRPGSTLYAVWTHDRSGFARSPFDLGGDLGALWDTPGRNVFVVKASWWVGR